MAHDWRRLAVFYEDVLGCVPVPPERSLSGPELERGTGVPEARLQGLHLRLPGHGSSGPTLELFQYEPSLERGSGAVNQPGFAHLAFEVSRDAEDSGEATGGAARGDSAVDKAVAHVLSAGGSRVGKTVSLSVSETTKVTFAYVTDPEGNVIELQSWSRSSQSAH